MTDQTASTVAAGAGALSAITNMVSTAKDSFNKSGGNEVLSSVKASIPKGAQDYLANAKSKFINREHIRPISVFFGIGEESPFYVEKNPSLIVSRVKHNIQFFYMNYIILFSVLFCLTMITSPTTLICLGLLGAAWGSMLRYTGEGSVELYGITVSQKQASITMAVISGLVLFNVLSHVFWWTLFSGGFISGIHAFLRDASMHKDEEDRIEMTGDVAFDAGEDASFLNPQQSNDVV